MMNEKLTLFYVQFLPSRLQLFNFSLLSFESRRKLIFSIFLMKYFHKIFSFIWKFYGIK